MEVTKSWKPRSWCVPRCVPSFMVTPCCIGPIRTVASNKEGYFAKLKDSEVEGQCPSHKTGKPGPCSATKDQGDSMHYVLKLTTTHHLRVTLSVTNPVNICLLGRR